MNPPTFADLGVPSELCELLSARGIASPFPIQAATVPDSLSGRDVCGRAPTGSGKTLAFSLTIATRARRGSSGYPTALVLVPTRELATQVAEEITALRPFHGHKVVTIFGGTGYGRQRQALKHGASVVVACPGRLEDLVQQGDLRLDDVDLVVLDEADRMADMGFLPVVKRLLDQTDPKRQTLLFSATLDKEIDVLVRRYQHDPARHEVESDEADRGDVTHRFWEVDRAERVDVTAGLVRRHERVMVFCRTRHGADRLTRQLARVGVEARAVHGARSQSQREKALAAFMRGRVGALVATDVAARGIHVDGVDCVVHFDPPTDVKDYIHRSGRTARAGADGTVVSLILSDQRKQARQVQRALELPTQLTPPDLAPEDLEAREPVRPAAGGGGQPKRHRNPGGHRQGAAKQGAGKRGAKRPDGSPAGQATGTGTRGKPKSRRRKADSGRPGPGAPRHHGRSKGSGRKRTRGVTRSAR